MRLRFRLRRARPIREERGAVVVVVAACMVGMLIVGAMVLDFGVIRVDKQRTKLLADAAAAAGMTSADGGTGEVYTFRAVCGALDHLRSSAELAGLPDDICAAGALAAKLPVTCSQTNALTHASYDRTTSYGGATYRVVVKAPYTLTSGGWSEESLPNLAGDQSTRGGCDQIGVEISVTRKPGLGSLATDGNMRVNVRSAARAILSSDSSFAPALILLERTACNVVTVGSAGGGSGSKIWVKGFGASPGSIHVDSDATGSGCGSGSGQQLYQGKQNDGIVAYGSVSPAGTSGFVSSYATLMGRPTNVVSDSNSFVYGTTAASGTGGTASAVLPRDRVTRTPIDERYRQPIRTAISQVAATWDNPDASWTQSGCSPNAVQLAAPKLWINCTGNSGLTLTDTILSQEVYINGFVKNGNLKMPNATRVYISNTASGGSPINSAAVTLTQNSAGFCVRTTACGTSPALSCGSAATSSRARVFVRQGNIESTGGALRMCSSSVIMLGNNISTGCVPASTSAANAPTSTPCTTSPTSGNGLIDVTGGAVIDWTAPNEYAGSIPSADQATAFGNLEDLALWSESAGLYKFSGGGGLNTVGVFMVPNGDPVSVGGGSSQTLVNSQYVARKFSVSGGGTLELTTDSRNVVTIPTFLGLVMIR